MNPSDHDHDSLLSDLFDGPDVESVLATIRKGKAAASKRRRIAAGAAIAVIAASACLFSLLESRGGASRIARHPTVEKQVPTDSAEASDTAAFAIERVDDEQLIDLLAGHPVALVHLPSGEQRLLLVEDHGQGEDASIISL